MEKVKRLNHFQKGILFLLLAMTLVFAALYAVTTSKVGFAYQNTIFLPRQENGSLVYSGKINGQPAQFTVSEDKRVVFQCGDTTYGPYTAKEDPAAIPQTADMPEDMFGVELWQGEEVLFRGGVLKVGDSYWLYNADGTFDSSGSSYTTGDGLARDGSGTVIDSSAPSAPTILELMNEPVLRHKGEWFGWFAAVFVCILNALSILFAEQLFRWNLAFQIRDADRAEPSDWEITGRYVFWIFLTVMALVLFVTGLR